MNYNQQGGEMAGGVFKFQYLPDYAKFLLDNKLEEFTTVAIRYCREFDLPMMRPLSKLPESKLIELSIFSTKELLSALAENDVESVISRNISNYLQNNIQDWEGNKVIDHTEIAAEDFIQGFFIRRKVFSFFLYSYTPNTALHSLIASEVDFYTTQEHLLTTKAFIELLKAKN